MATLSGNKIKDTYQSLIKLTDNGNLTTGAKQVTDGFGNNSPLYISTTQIGIGVTPEVGYDLHVYSDAKVGGNLTITGNLVVNGTTTTVDTDTLRVEDPLIELARLNTSADSVDIGFYGKYHPSGTTLYSGLFRDAGDDKYKLFKDLQEEPTTTVNTSGTGFDYADLVVGNLETQDGATFGGVVVCDFGLQGNITGDITGDVTGDLTGNVTGDLTGNVTATSVLADGVTATTQSTGDNSTKVATTAYVDASIGNSTLAEVLVNGDTTGGGNIVFGDSGSFLADDTLMFGASNDLVIYHDGSNSFIREKGTGNLYIDSDVSINFRSYTGAENMLVANKDGSVDLYYDASKKLETSSTGITVTGVIVSDGLDVGDSEKIRLGDSQDLEIYHNGTYSELTNNTGTLYIRQKVDDGDVEILSDGGDGTTEVVYFRANGGEGSAQLFHYGSIKLGTSSTGIQVTGDTTTTGSYFADTHFRSSDGNATLSATGGGGIYLRPDGYNQTTSQLFVAASGGDTTIAGTLTVSGTGQSSFAGQVTIPETPSADTDAASKGYVDSKFEETDTLAEVLANGNTTGGTDIEVNGDNINFADGSLARFGASNDLKLQHNGTNSFIDNETGALFIRQKADDSDIIFQSDDGSGGLATYFNLDGSATNVKVEKAFVFKDNVKANFGDGNDLQIYHDGSNSYITDSGTGDLYIQGSDDIYITAANGEKFITCNTDGSVEIRYDNVKKFETTSTGVTVTGGASFTDNIDIVANNKHIRWVDTYGNWLIEVGDGANNFKIHSQSLNADYLTLEGGGQLNLGEYGSGSFTGTATYRLAVDSSGDVIEIPIGDGAVDGSGAAGQVAVWSDTDTITGYTRFKVYDAGGQIQVTDGTRDIRVNSGYGGTTAMIGTSSSHDLGFMTANSQRVTIDSSGLVGIGTTSPNEKLEVRAASSSDAKISISKTDDTAGQSSVLMGHINNLGGVASLYNDAGTENIKFRSYGDSYINGGNVGIGTSSPSAKLDVRKSGTTAAQGDTDLFVGDSGAAASTAQVQILGGASGYSNLYFSDTSAYNVGGFIYNHSSNYLATNVNGSERMRIDSSGNVGIGGNNSSYKLISIGDYYPIAWQRSGGTIGTLYSDSTSVGIGVSNLNNAGIFFTSGQHIDFRVNGGTKMFLNSSGNVGIGHASPTQPLYISGAGNYDPTSSGGQTTNGILIRGGTTTGDDSYTAGIGFAHGTGTSGISGVQTNGSDGDRMGLAFFTHSSGTGSTASSEAMRIESDGNVGIGTTSPSARLHIDHASNPTELRIGNNTADDVWIQFNTDGNDWSIGTDRSDSNKFKISDYSRVGTNDRLVIDTSGNVGIGTTNAVNSKLYVANAGVANLIIGYNNTSNNYFDADTQIFRNSSAVERMRIASDGQVTVTGTSTTMKLYNGASSTGVLHFGNADFLLGYDSGVFKQRIWDGADYFNAIEYNGASHRLILAPSEGSVGIGTTSPSEKLDITGGYLKFNGGDYGIKGSAGLTYYATSEHYFYTGGTERMRITSGGYILTGGRTSVTGTWGAGSIEAERAVGAFNSNKTIYLFNNGSTFKLDAYDYGASSALDINIGGNGGDIILNGNVGIGTTNPGDKLEVTEGGSAYSFRGVYSGTSGSYGAGAFQLTGGSTSPSLIDFIYSTTFVGQIVTTGSGVLYQSNSDYRLKENVVEMTGALDRVNQLNPSRFNFIGHEEIVDGFLAHELQEVVPQAVSGEKDGTREDGTPKYQGVDNSQIVPLLVGAIKELKAEIETLKAQINN